MLTDGLAAALLDPFTPSPLSNASLTGESEKWCAQWNTTEDERDQKFKSSVYVCGFVFVQRAVTVSIQWIVFWSRVKS